MARKSGYKWLEKIAIYIHSENELFAYIGTPTNPRSSAIRFKKNIVNAPVKLPPISTKSLNQRHPNTAKLELKDTDFSEKIKFLYAYFERKEEIFTDAIEGENGHSSIVTTSKELKALKIDKLLNIVYRHADFDKWFVKKKRPTPIFNSLIRVLSRPSRNSRQIALTQIVSELTQRKELPKAFLLLLLGLRDELTIAIFRELGRQQKFIYPFPEIAEYYFSNTTNEELRKYVFYYLLNQNDDSIIQSSLYKDLRATITIFSSISQTERVNQIINGLKGDLNSVKTCLIGIYGLQRNELSTLLLALYRKISIKKSHRENLRLASLYLLKLVEIAPNPEICGFIISVNTLGKSSFVYEDQKKITSIRIKEGPTDYTSKYVVRRTIKLLELWNQIGLDEYLTRALLFYIKHIPPEKIEIERRRISINRRLTGDWQKSHATLKKFGNKISSILGEDKNQLYHAIMTQSRLNNRFTLEWLDTSFRSKTLIQAMDEATGEDILSMYVNNLPKKLTKIVAKIIEEKKDLEIHDWVKTELEGDQLDKILTFFTTTQAFMPISLFEHIIGLIFNNEFDDIDRIVNYITSINHNQKPKISEKYLEVAFEYVERNVFDSIDNPIITKFCTNFVIEWEKITFRKPREEDEYRFEALRIVFEKELKTNKPNTWDNISVETIAYVYKLLKLHVPSLIDGSLQYAMNKPNWEQLARHYLAMGIVRPLASEVKKTRLKDVPKYLLRDIEGLIALITEIILYCERNGFNRAFEDLLIQHMYRRGWNIDRNIARKLPGLFGNISPRLRSYFAAYLVFEQGEVSNDILKFARDINNYQLRERVLITLERFATPEILIVLAESEFSDMSEACITKFVNLDLKLPTKKQLLPKLLRSTKIKLRNIGKEWITEDNIEPEIVLREIVPQFEDMYEFYFLQMERIKNLNEKKALLIFQFFKYIIWQPRMKNKWIKHVNCLAEMMIKNNLLTSEIQNEFNQLIHTQVQQRMDTILPTFIEVMDN
ncbi:MAG: hypothetical protein GPJ54_12960 [Candidatus Heimdallarchaeota archaeon]|nr:hypothetical protein [Candidatus Heimdallarchaeota archaeon]